MNVQKKTVLVTGAGRGIGRALAMSFATRGADVALLDMNTSRSARQRRKRVRQRVSRRDATKLTRPKKPTS